MVSHLPCLKPTVVTIIQILRRCIFIVDQVDKIVFSEQRGAVPVNITLLRVTNFCVTGSIPRKPYFDPTTPYAVKQNIYAVILLVKFPNLGVMEAA